MRIQILSAAARDLRDGYRVYERQAPRGGMYFLDSLNADVDSLTIHAGVHRVRQAAPNAAGQAEYPGQFGIGTILRSGPISGQQQ